MSCRAAGCEPHEAPQPVETRRRTAPRPAVVRHGRDGRVRQQGRTGGQGQERQRGSPHQVSFVLSCCRDSWRVAVFLTLHFGVLLNKRRIFGQSTKFCGAFLFS